MHASLPCRLLFSSEIVFLTHLTLRVGSQLCGRVSHLIPYFCSLQVCLLFGMPHIAYLQCWLKISAQKASAEVACLPRFMTALWAL